MNNIVLGLALVSSKDATYEYKKAIHYLAKVVIFSDLC